MLPRRKLQWTRSYGDFDGDYDGDEMTYTSTPVDYEVQQASDPIHRFTHHRCVECGTGCTTQCGRCNTTNYCSNTCQISGWAHHKKTCGVPPQTRYTHAALRAREQELYRYMLTGEWSTAMARKYPHIDVLELVWRALRDKYPEYLTVVRNALNVYGCDVHRMMTMCDSVIKTAEQLRALLTIPDILAYVHAHSSKYLDDVVVHPDWLPGLIDSGIDATQWIHWEHPDSRCYGCYMNDARRERMRRILALAKKQQALKDLGCEWRPHNNETLPSGYRRAMRTLLLLAKAP